MATAVYKYKKEVEAEAKELLTQFEKKLKNMRSSVKKGIKWLDTQMPRKEWLKKIKLSYLDLGDSDMCICGQAFKDMFKEAGSDSGYEYAYDKLGQEKIEDYGFDRKSGDGGYELLTAVWYDAVKSLQDETKSKK